MNAAKASLRSSVSILLTLLEQTGVSITVYINDQCRSAALR
jgi:hypothetical protein